MQHNVGSAAHGGDPEIYAGILETLVAAGAKVSERHTPLNARIDALLERYGSPPEPAGIASAKDRGGSESSERA